MNSSSLLLLLLSFLFLLLINSSSSAASVGKVGERTEIKNAATDKKVQSLGLFSVEEHNRGLLVGGLRREGTPSSLRLAFFRVVEAQQQVVSGIEYFLKVEAKDRAGAVKRYDAIVLVKPWLRSQKLLSFASSSD